MRSRGPVCARRRRERRPLVWPPGRVLGVEPGCCDRPCVRVSPSGCPSGAASGAAARPSEGPCVQVCARGLCVQVGAPSAGLCAQLAASGVCARVGCPSEGLRGGCARSGAHIVCVCVWSAGCVSPRVCICASTSGSGPGLGLGVVWGRGVCRSLGPGQLVWGGGRGSSAVLGGDGHIFPFPLAGWVGGWAVGRWTDGGMRGRGVDRWARGEARRPGPSPPTPPQSPHPTDLRRWGQSCLHPDGQAGRPLGCWGRGGGGRDRLRLVL